MILVSDATSLRLFLADDDYEPKAYELIRGKLSKQAESEIVIMCMGVIEKVDAVPKVRELRLGNAIFYITKQGDKPYVNYRLQIVESLGTRSAYFSSLKELFSHIKELRKSFSSYRN